jgi:lipopolysaccharide/colanic/teichoic acid biosynthesis glycosyltransferase
MLKRALDLFLAGAGLIFLAPLMLVIALLVRLNSRGPAFFRQIRIARGGRPFEILKFRSMVSTPVPDGGLVTADGDPRITSVGAFLRRTKLDELPQLINVLKGDMSFVGPRPEVPKYVAMYPPLLREIILSVRPGITDEASIEFRDESAQLARAADPETTYVKEILPRKLEIYARYAQHHSLLGDLHILAKTLLLVVRR